MKRRFLLAGVITISAALILALSLAIGLRGNDRSTAEVLDSALIQIDSTLQTDTTTEDYQEFDELTYEQAAQNTSSAINEIDAILQVNIDSSLDDLDELSY